MAKQTAAQKHIKAHQKRRTERLDNRKMPTFPSPLYLGGVQVVTDIDGNLYRVDAEHGSIRKLRWEQ